MKQFAILFYSGIKHFNAFLHDHHGVLPSCRSELTSCLSCVHELFCPDPGPCDPPCDHDHEPSCPEIWPGASPPSRRSASGGSQSVLICIFQEFLFQVCPVRLIINVK